MKHIAINVHYNGVDYCSEWEEHNAEEEEALKELIIVGVKQGFTYLEIPSYNTTYFFNSEQLKNSIISLVYKKEAF